MSLVDAVPCFPFHDCTRREIQVCLISWHMRKNLAACAVSGWDGVNCLHSNRDCDVLSICALSSVDNTPMFWLLPKSACTAWRHSLYPNINPKWVGWGWAKSQEETAETADSNWPKRYSIPYDVMLSNKISRKGGGRGNMHGYSICFPKQQLWILTCCFPGSGWTTACQ